MSVWTGLTVLTRLAEAHELRYYGEFAAVLAQRQLTLETVIDMARRAYDAHRTAMHWHQARREEREMAHRRKGMICSFCGKKQDQVQRLIAGPGVYICDECIGLCNEILAEELHNPPLPAHAPEAAARGVRRAMVPWWRRILKTWRLDLWLVAGACGG